jgi:hypothetical protein
VSTPDDQELMEGDLLLLDAYAQDDDGDDLTYALTSTPSSEIGITPRTGAIRWLEAVPGTYEIEVTVTDGEETVTHGFTVLVEEEPIVVPPENKVPVIQQVAGAEATAKEPFTLSLSGSDADPWDTGNLTFTLVSGPEGMIVSADGSILWLPTGDDVGTHPVVVGLSDSKNSTTMEFDVEVVKSTEDEDGTESSDGYMWMAIALVLVVVVLVALLVLMYVRQQ